MSTIPTRYETCLQYTNLVLCTVLVVVSVYGVLTLPERVPIHFKLSGEADQWGKPTSLLMLTVVCLIIEGLFWVAYRIPPELMNFPGPRTSANMTRQVENIRELTATMQAVVAAYFLGLVNQWIWTATHVGSRLTLWIPYVFMGVLLITTGVFIVRAYRMAEHG